jgi:DNA primase catalytic subunit
MNETTEFLCKNIQGAKFGYVQSDEISILLTDYDDIRSCCSGGEICMKCWDFMTISVKVLDAALRDDFGFKHLLWIYSGRRGVHCWIADDRARKLTQESRRAIVTYLEVVKGGEQVSRKVNLPGATNLHPSLRYDLICIFSLKKEINLYIVELIIFFWNILKLF